MSKLYNNQVVTSESVCEGHPDKICDQISDAILDACLAKDSNSKAACKTAVTTEIQVVYARGVARPLSINVDTFGTAYIEEKKSQAALESDEVFDFRPVSIVKDLELANPTGWSYRQTAVAGHFGRDIFPWEQTDKVDNIQEALDYPAMAVA